MTSPFTTLGITFNATDLQDFDGLYLEIAQGLDESPTSIRGIDVVVPAADGRTARPRRMDERRIVLNGFVRGDGATQAERQADFRTNVRALNTLFPTGGGAAVTPQDLVVTLEDGDTATIACRALNIVTSPVILSEWSAVSVELVAVEEWEYA